MLFERGFGPFFLVINVGGQINSNIQGFTIMKFKDIITESVKTFTDAGIPRDFAEQLVSKFKVKHDAELTRVEGKPRKADLERGDMLINVLPSGEVIAMMTDDGLRSSGYMRIRYTPEGEFKTGYHTSIQDALSGMTKRGPMFMLKHDGIFGLRRLEKPDAEDQDIDRRTYGGDTISGEVGNIFEYMNRVFMPKMKPVLQRMVDEIYSNLRKLPKDLNKYGRNASVMNSQRAEALEAASAIEDIIEQGFNRESLAEFLQLQGVKVSSSQYFRTSWENLRDALRDFAEGDNLIRAKWAKAFLEGAKYHRDQIRDLVAAPVVDALVSETTSSGSVASVASPMGGVKKRSGSLLSGKKTNKKYANSKEARKQVKQIKENQSVSEDDISEQDLIVVPSQAKKVKSGFVSHEHDRRDHEVEMALSDLYQCAKNAKRLYELLKDVSEEEGIEGWVQEKIIKSNDYLNTIREYLEHKDMSEKHSLKDEDKLKEKAESEAQATAARIALAAKKGKIPKSELEGASKEMFGMSKSDLEDFTKVKKGAPKKKSSG